MKRSLHGLRELNDAEQLTIHITTHLTFDSLKSILL